MVPGEGDDDDDDEQDLAYRRLPLSLRAAVAIADGVIRAASDLPAFRPVTVTVLDAAGGVLVQKRMDGCPGGAYSKFSLAKAATCRF